jgi:hypothetical protein
VTLASTLFWNKTIGNKERALKCLDFCGNKFLKDLIELFCENSLRYVIICDWKDEKVLNLVNNLVKLNPPLDFKNDSSDKRAHLANSNNLRRTNSGDQEQCLYFLWQ